MSFGALAPGTEGARVSIRLVHSADLRLARRARHRLHPPRLRQPIDVFAWPVRVHKYVPRRKEGLCSEGPETGCLDEKLLVCLTTIYKSDVST